MRFVTCLSLIVSVVVVVAAEVHNKACCPAVHGRCADESWGQPCCGSRACDAECCNCQGGCRFGPAGSSAFNLDDFKNMDDMTEVNEEQPLSINIV